MRKLKELFQVKRILTLILAAAMTVTTLPAEVNAAPVTDTELFETEEDFVPGTDSTEPDGVQLDSMEVDGTQPDETEISVESEIKHYTFEYDESNLTDYTTAEYSQGQPRFTYQSATGAPQVNNNILQNIRLVNSENKDERYSLTDTWEDIVKTVTYSWKKQDQNGNYVDLKNQDGAETAPAEFGRYQLIIKLPAKENEYEAAEAAIDFEIKKAVVEIAFDLLPAAPGSPVSGIKESLEDFTVTASDGTTFLYAADDPDTQDTDESQSSDLKFIKWNIHTVKNGNKSDAPLNDTDILTKTEEYVLAVEAAFTDKVTDADNYEIKDCEVKTVLLGSLRETIIDITLTDKWTDEKYAAEECVPVSDETRIIPKITVKTYDTKAIADLVKDTDYTAAVKEAEWITGEDGTPVLQKKDIAGAATEAAGRWYSADYKSWTERQKKYCNLTVGGELESAPCDAGVYVYRITYAGEKGLYEKSYADIVIEIKAAELIIKPELKKNTFYRNQSAADVLTQISYQVYGKDGSPQPDINEAVKKTDSFWGTSQWINNKTVLTQPYEPVFTVYETKTAVTKDADGNVINEEKETRALSPEETLQFSSTVDNTSYEYSYEVRFSGKKSVYRYYNDYTSAIETVDINKIVDSSNPGYQVIADEDTLKANTAAFEVTDAVMVTVNTDEITKDTNFAEKTLTFTDEIKNETKNVYTIYSKIFDSENLYVNRTGYKKAKVEDETGKTIVPGVDSSLTYRWYRTSDYTDAADIQEALLQEEKPLEYASWYSVSGISPYSAGIYKLEITYDNSQTGYYAVKPTAEIYFEIEKQQIKAVPGKPEGGYTAFTNTTVADFIEETGTADSSVKKLDGTQWTDSGWLADENYYQSGRWSDGTYYALQWEVQKEMDVPAENGGTVKEWITIENPSGTYFEKEANYRLAVSELTVRSNNYTDSVHSFDQETKTGKYTYLSTDTVPITVEEMGTVQLKLHTGSEEPIRKEKVYDGVSVFEDADLSAKLAAIKVTEIQEGRETAPFTLEGLTLTYKYYDKDNNRMYPILPEEAVNGGTYYVYAGFKGNKNYAPLKDENGGTEILVAEAEITKRKVKVSAPSEITVTAGTQVSVVKSENRSKLIIEGVGLPAEGADRGIVAKDREAFTYNYYYAADAGNNYDDKHVYGYPAWSFSNQPQPGVYDRQNNSITNRTVIKYGTGYELKIASLGSLRGAHTRNYELETGKTGKMNVERGSSSISSVAYKGTDGKGTIEKINSVIGKNKLTHTFTALNGIKYSSYYNDEEKKTLSGNFVAVRIQAPDEYESRIPDTAIYRKSIEEAGGYIAVESSINGFITVIFDASKGDKTFVIRWEEDYVETYNMKFPKDLLLNDLTQAVAPKSIAFNSPNKKMVVGAAQNLDVKLTKVQKDDVICLAYKVSDKSVLNVNDNGRVVALKPGTATVTVYPVYLENGIKTKITNAKSADVKITVTEVSAPKITKITAYDDSVSVQYPYVADNNYYTYGYRREIYVQKVSGRAWTAKEFEEQITNMPNGQWEGIFATEPVFLTNTNEYNRRVFDSKKHIYTNMVGYEIDGLEPSCQYNVYVRNVSLIRTLPDGSEVVKSAQGSVKAFTTTKMQIDGLTGLLNDKNGKQLKENLYRNDEIHDENGFETGGIVNLERPSGFYDEYQNYFNEIIQYKVDLSEGKVNLAAEGWIFDSVEEKMARAGQSGADFIAPKLAYYFINTASAYVYDAYSGELVSPGNEYRTTLSSLASINKKGQITLKQTGYFCIAAVDTNTGIQSNKVHVQVTAQVTGIKGKTTSMETGQTCYLADMVTYQSGKKTLTGWGFTRNITVADEALKKEIEEGGYFKVSDDGRSITALKAGGSRTFELTDSSVQKNAKVTIKSKPLSPVKNLKLTNVIDRRFTISFEGSYYADGYRIEVVNARGKVIKSVYVKTDGAQNAKWNYRYENNGKNGRYYGEYIVDTGLTQQSKYSVKVTALYGDEASRTVSKSGSTTRLPAADYGLTDISMNTGADGTVIKLLNSSYSGIHSNNFVSGNSYTLIANPANPAAKHAGTDKLTWSSSDKKTATVKANAGTYSATLKALKAGTTVIEVKSSVLKCVIARYKITVRTVGDAYASNCYYYGDNEDLRGDGERPGESYTKLTLGNAAPADLASGEYKWFTFTASEQGTYSFYRIYNGNRYETGFSVYNASGSSINKTCVLDKGQTVYIKATASGSYTLNVERKRGSGPSERTPVTLGENVMQASAGQWFVFTADQKGLYSFTNNGYVTFAFYENLNDIEEITRGISAKYWLEEGETVYMQVRSASGSNSFTMIVEQIKVTPLTADKAAVSTGSGNETAWFSFVVPADAEYEFALTSRGTIALYSSPNANDKIEQNTGRVSLWLSKGKTILAEVPSNNELSVTTKTIVEEMESGQPVTAVLSGSYSYFSFLASEAGIYQFSSENADGAEAYLIADLAKTNDGSYIDYDTVYSGNFCVDCYLEANTKVYLKVRSDNGVQDDINIKVVKKTPISITAEGTPVSIAAGLTEWFSFSADAKNTLIFKSQGTCRKYFYENSGSAGADKGIFTDFNSTELYDPSAGTVYYKVRNIDAGTDTTVTVRAKEYTVQPVTDKLTVKIESGLEQRFSFTAEDAAEYVFSFGSDAALCAAYFWYADPEDSMDGASFSFVAGNSASTAKDFTANEKGYFRIKNNGSNDTNVTIKAKKKVTVPIINGSAETELYANINNSASRRTVSFTSPKDAIYSFSFTSDTDTYAALYKNENLSGNSHRVDFLPEYDGSEGGRGTYYAAYMDYYVAKGDTIYWDIKNKHSGLDTTVTVKAEEVPVTVIPADGVEDVPLISGTDQWFSFTADPGEDARYTFTFTGNTGTRAYLYRTLDALNYEGSVVYLYGAQRLEDRYIAAGQTVYWKMTGADDDTVAVKAHKIEVNEWPENEESVTVEAWSDKLYKFTAADEGRYILKLFGQKSYGAVLYSALDDSTPISINVNYKNVSGSVGYAGETDWYIAANESVYIRVRNYTAEEISFTLTTDIVSYNPWPAEDASIEMEAGLEKWYAYTASESGRYGFTLTGDVSCTGYLYSSFEENEALETIFTFSSDSKYTGKAEYYIEANTTVYCKVVNDSNGSNNITLKAAPIIPHVLTTDENSVIEFEVRCSSEWAHFEAPATGMYRFSVAYESGDGYLARYADMKNTNFIDRVNIFSSRPEEALVYYLEKGKTFYIKVYPFMSSRSFKGSLKAEFVSGAQKLELDSAVQVSVDTSASKYQLLEFTAQKDGRYRFYSEGSDDSKAWFFWNMDVNANYNMDNKSDFLDDNSGTDNNFSKIIDMDAGQTINVAVGHSRHNADITTTVYVKEAKEMILLTLNESSSLDVNSREYQWYSFTAPSDGDYIFYSDQNEGDPKAWFFRGQTIYIAVGHYSLSDSVKASIHVTN